MKLKTYGFWMWLIVSVGILFRCAEYAAAGSFWHDEALIVFKLLHYPLEHIIRPLEGDMSRMQALPAGYILLQKMVIRFFGEGELSLRFYSFLTGTMSLALFPFLARRLLPRSWSLLALALFAFNPNLIYFTAETKPYAGDVFWAILLSILFLRVMSKHRSPMDFVGLLICGSLSLVMSFPSVFILGGITLMLMIHYAAVGRWSMARRFLIFGLVWAGIEAWQFWYTLQYYLVHGDLIDFWDKAFLPWREGLFAQWVWIVAIFKRLFQNMLHVPGGIAVLCCFCGLLHFQLNRKVARLILLPPVLMTLLAAGLHLYPFDGRVVTFLLPAVIILLARGIELLSYNAVLKHRRKIGVLLASIMLFYPVQLSVIQFIEPATGGEIRPVLSYLSEHRFPMEKIFISSGSLPAWRIYASSYGLPENPLVLEKAEDQSYRDEADRILGWLQEQGERRMWLFFSHVTADRKTDEKSLYLNSFLTRSKLLDSYEMRIKPYSTPLNPENNVTASVYLLELPYADN